MHRRRQVASVCPAASERLSYFIVSDVFHNAAMEQILFILCNIKLDCISGVLACVGVFAHTRICVNSGEGGGREKEKVKRKREKEFVSFMSSLGKRPYYCQCCSAWLHKLVPLTIRRSVQMLSHKISTFLLFSFWFQMIMQIYPKEKKTLENITTVTNTSMTY